MRNATPGNLARDLVLPIVLFAALGGMTWAVRGSSGYGGTQGCIFAGVMWGTAWWFISREPRGTQSRPYTSGWIVLAMTIGVGFAGGRGWAQWTHFFDGRLSTNYAAGEFTPISPAYGFLWQFISGVPWGGLGACLLAWCGSRHARWWQWPLRIAFGVGGYYIALQLFRHYPQYFLPLYSVIEDQYKDFQANPSLRRLVNDNRAAICHLGMYLGFLLFEVCRRDWRNVVLIATVGLLNGIGWSLLQNWTWAERWWGGAFNWWRCWESTGGMSIGIGLGVAYYLVNRPLNDHDRAALGAQLTNQRPNLERLGCYLGLLLGLGLSIRNGLKGWANIYLGNEDYWSAFFWRIIGPAMLITLAAILLLIYLKRLPRHYEGDVFPHDWKVMWLVFVVLNALALLVTGPVSEWKQLTFCVYYMVLFAVSAVVAMRLRKESPTVPPRPE
ncbi:MAG: hypothetical protein AMXMBFR84_28240 [Candidatus Hydrogenedentota bacterium]